MQLATEKTQEWLVASTSVSGYQTPIGKAKGEVIIAVIVFVIAATVFLGSIVLELLPEKWTGGFEVNPFVALSACAIALLFLALLSNVIVFLPVWAVLASRGYFLDRSLKLQWSGLHGWNKVCLWAVSLWTWAGPVILGAWFVFALLGEPSMKGWLFALAAYGFSFVLFRLMSILVWRSTSYDTETRSAA